MLLIDKIYLLKQNLKYAIILVIPNNSNNNNVMIIHSLKS